MSAIIDDRKEKAEMTSLKRWLGGLLRDGYATLTVKNSDGTTVEDRVTLLHTEVDHSVQPKRSPVRALWVWSTKRREWTLVKCAHIVELRFNLCDVGLRHRC